MTELIAAIGEGGGGELKNFLAVRSQDEPRLNRRIERNSEALQIVRNPARVEPTHGGGIEWLAGAKDRRHRALLAAGTGCPGNRHVRPRRPHAAARKPVCIENGLRWFGIA